MEKKDKKSGGARKNSGTKLKYGEPTQMFYCRVPSSKKEAVGKLVRNFISDFEVKNAPKQKTKISNKPIT